ncbi:hypothetical protein A3B18_02330 [Candidatus Giovannonibacteria bacterium RIFCSPLOWO2_01_FULL_46_13]|uniref:YggT family protein n=1 Tax=Candidatus Giovannonibacteria bacterium RIFCSPLOWO2_01_FULL_46_13 TaxID=1798352 RepID=A0A1F5X556_9BACT|nr:MAG: hypothetical protein A3B18_02330 [Candidatus Giovannonibacteria bacterium RIFCSPLOWO2_01_FULL_46_13]
MNESKERVKPLYRGTQIVWYILYVLETLLVFRFVLRLIGANPAAGFTDFIYTLTLPFVAPFLNVVGSPRVAGSVFEWTTLLAILVYWLLAWGIVKLLVMGKPVSTPEAEVKLDRQDR